MPSPVTSTFDGLMSRWSTPRSCAWSSASAMPAPHQAIAGDRSARNSAARPAERPGRRFASSAPGDRAPRRARPRSRAFGPAGRRAAARASPGQSRACRGGAGRSPGRSGTSGPERCACAGAGPGSAARASRSARPSRPPAGRRAAAPGRGRPARTRPAQLLDQVEPGDRLAGLGEGIDRRVRHGECGRRRAPSRPARGFRARGGAGSQPRGSARDTRPVRASSCSSSRRQNSS